jgi:3'-phosphoadenosine 5'-phosphosulfate sulfotransferase (PAPS reductase)/FAD synthetase
VLAHRCRDQYGGLAFIDTGTAVPGVAEFVRKYAHWLDKPLRIMHAGNAYRRMVLGGDVLRDGTVRPGLGFPGPAMHGRAYIVLKERQIAKLLRESKAGHSRRARVVFLSGIRRAESQRRSQRKAIGRMGNSSAVFVNPLLNWSASDMARYRQAYRIPESDAAALLHRSGECNCGAFASAERERAMLKALYPDFFAEIEELEAEAEAMGLRWCRWGGYDRDGNRATDEPRQAPGLLCESCDSRQTAVADEG